MNQVADILKEAKALISDKANWCQDTFSKQDADGHTQYCAYGAFCTTADDSAYSQKAYRFLNDAAATMYNFASAVRVNDQYGHEAVMKMYDEAIRMAESQA